MFFTPIQFFFTPLCLWVNGYVHNKSTTSSHCLESYLDHNRIIIINFEMLIRRGISLHLCYTFHFRFPRRRVDPFAWLWQGRGDVLLKFMWCLLDFDTLSFKSTYVINLVRVAFTIKNFWKKTTRVQRVFVTILKRRKNM